eukprot:6090300-Amphidinium_carterae.1
MATCAVRLDDAVGREDSTFLFVEALLGVVPGAFINFICVQIGLPAGTSVGQAELVHFGAHA